MNLIPQRVKSIFGRGTDQRGKSNDMSGSALVRAAMTLGPWDALLHTFVPHQVNPYFYEALRKAMPLLDGGINKLVILDGLVRFTGKDQALCDEIDAAMRELPVDDMETGLQAAYELMGNEAYEQGVAMAERVMDARGRKMVGLRTADSKGLLARRNEQGNIEWYYRPPAWQIDVRQNGTDYTETVLRNNIVNVTPGYLNNLNYLRLEEGNIVYTSFQPESNNPYGVSLLRSIEFVSQNLLRIQNATGRAWDRFGDPPFLLKYKTKNRALKQGDLDKRRDVLGQNLSNVLAAKRQGNSADMVQAIGADDDITVEVIGGKGDVLEIQLPAQHMVEQILAKIPIPGWMIGLTEAQAGRMADQQSEMALMESKVRFERRLPALTSIVNSWLRGQGITWKPGDWQIVQELPNLRDVMKQAQARFLNAQANMMENGRNGEIPPTPTGVTYAQGGDPNAGKGARLETRVKKNGDVVTRFTFPCGHTHRKGAGGEDDAEPWAEQDPELPLIEAQAVNGLLELWGQLEKETLEVLKLPAYVAGGSEVWTFDASTMLQPLLDKQELFIQAAGDEEGPLLQQAFAAFVRGLENAASEFDAEAAVDELRAQIADELTSHGLDLVRNGAVRTYHDGIIDELRTGAYDGLNPERVSAQLSDAFDLGDYNWQRLGRSEIARAQAMGKVEQYTKLGVTQANFVTAGGACPICEDLAAGGPYDLDKVPQPVDDSHPNCFPAGTVVRYPGLLGSSERWYEGELIEIITASGIFLSGTPNHPILTPNGWVPFKLLREGDDVVRCFDGKRAMGFINPDDDHAPSLIEDIAVTLGTASPVPTISVPTTAEDFHGDGMQSDVNVVGADCLLQDGRKPAITKEGGHGTFVGVDAGLVQLTGQSAFALALVRRSPSARSSIGRTHEALALMNGRSGHAVEHRFTAIPNRDSSANETAIPSRATDAATECDRFEALAGFVTPDRIIEIRKSAFSGHVYNLETTTGWYIANGVIVHNCRCTVLAVDPAESDQED